MFDSQFEKSYSIVLSSNIFIFHICFYEVSGTEFVASAYEGGRVSSLKDVQIFAMTKPGFPD